MWLIKQLGYHAWFKGKPCSAISKTTDASTYRCVQQGGGSSEATRPTAKAAVRRYWVEGYIYGSLAHGGCGLSSWLCAAIFVDTGADMRIDMLVHVVYRHVCLHMYRHSYSMYRHVCSYVYRHVHRHVHRNADRHVHRHVDRHVHRHVHRPVATGMCPSMCISMYTDMWTGMCADRSRGFAQVQGT